MTTSLDEMEIASPCGASWEAMTGDARTRFCGECRQHVFDVAGLDRAAALDLVRRAGGGERVCVRFYRRADGTVLTADCPVGLRAARQKALRFAGRLAAAVLVAASTLAGGSGCTRGSRARQVEPLASIIEYFDPTPPPRGGVIMGMIAAPPPQPPPPPVPAPPPTLKGIAGR